MTTLQTTAPRREIRVIPLPHCIHASRFNMVLYYVSLVLLGGSLFANIHISPMETLTSTAYIAVAAFAGFFVVYFRFISSGTFMALFLASLLFCPLILYVHLHTVHIIYDYFTINVKDLFFNIVSICLYIFLNATTLYCIRILTIYYYKFDIKHILQPFLAFTLGTSYFYSIAALILSLYIGTL